MYKEELASVFSSPRFIHVAYFTLVPIFLSQSIRDRRGGRRISRFLRLETVSLVIFWRFDYQKMKTHKIYLLLVFFLLISIAGPASSLTKDLLGVAPEDEKYFRPEIIKCKDGSRKFTKAQLNDDFCDCTDGTDEPGTSACPGGMFHCRNSGHVPLSLFSSRVNDGICDCCDGSDEYDGKMNCSNTCWEAGKAAREKLIKKIVTYQEGVSIRKQEVEQAKHAIAKDEAELSKLKNEEKILKGLVQQLKEHKEQIEKVEEKERLEKEKEEKRKKEAEEKADQEKNESSETPTDDTPKVPEDPPVDQDLVDDKSESEVEVEIGDNAESEESHTHGVGQHATQEGKDESIAVPESGHDAGTEASPYDLVKEKKYGSGSTEGLSREELGRLVASRWTGENTEQQTKGIDSGKEEAQESEEIKPAQENEEMKPENVIDEEYDDSNSETEEENHKYDEHDIEDVNVDDVYGEDNEEYGVEDLENLGDTQRYESDDETDYSDITGIGSSSWLDKIRQTVRNILQAVKLFQTPVDISEAARVRKEYDDSSAKLSKIQSRISKLTEKLKQDFGAQKEFYSFYNRCFENRQNKYVYKVCPFKQASQVEGHGSTQLGQWNKFEDSYKVMLFSNGANCWNGPDRSLKVKLRCGLKNELADVDEPSRCEYVAVLSTPALCLEEKLKELQQKLDLMNKEQPQDHDEL